MTPVRAMMLASPVALLRRLVPAAALASAAASCTYPATAVIVTLGSDIAPSRLHAIRAYVRHDTTIAQPGATPNHEWHTDTLDGGSFLPASFTVVPGASDPRDVHVTLVVEADLDASTAGGIPVTIRRIARFATTPQHTTEVGMWLASRCGDRTTGCTGVSDPALCTVSARCEEQGLTCGDNGTCTSVEVMTHPPVGLPEAGPDVPSPPATVSPQIAISVHHACAIDPSHNVHCWGANPFGERGDSNPDVLAAPGATAVVDSATSLAVGRDFSCALRTDGTVWCWGANSLGQLGDGTGISRPTPAAVLGVANAIALTAGQAHACAVIADGTVKCWGNGNQGQLGHGLSRLENVPVVVSGLTDAAGVIASTEAHTCVARRDGTAVCWGINDNGQLGASVPTGPGTTSNVPVAVEGLADVVTLAAGSQHSCASRRDGSIVCWGRSSFGELGPAAVPAPAPPAQFRIVDGLGGPCSSVAAGLAFTCVLGRDGSVRCFGLNDSYVVSDASERAITMPHSIAIARPADALVAGGLSACVHDASGTFSCWGQNTYRQLGDGQAFVGGANASTVSLTSPLEVAVGDAHACARTSTDVMCWGSNTYAQIGAVGPAPPSPRSLGVANAAQLALGEASTLVRRDDGSVLSWGLGAGASGNGGVFALPGPVVDIAAGGFHGCARDATTAWCWGSNMHGELGDGTVTDRTTAAAVDLGGAAPVQLALGESFTCALTGASGARSVTCWGANESGQLGDGTMVERHTPSASMASGDIEEITAGAAHACARRSSGAVVCWGRNDVGELGNGTTTSSAVPLDVAGITDAAHISAGDRFTCATRATGAVVCWGANDFEQLGASGTRTATTPIAVTAVPADVTELATGTAFACALRTGGTVQCWGTPDDGRLGDGSASTPTPRAVANWP